MKDLYCKDYVVDVLVFVGQKTEFVIETSSEWKIDSLEFIHSIQFSYFV